MRLQPPPQFNRSSTWGRDFCAYESPIGSSDSRQLTDQADTTHPSSSPMLPRRPLTRWTATSTLPPRSVHSTMDISHKLTSSQGRPRLKKAVAKAYSPLFGRDIDPETEVTITTGANEGMLSAFMGFIEPGNEVIVFEPFFDQ